MSRSGLIKTSGGKIKTHKKIKEKAFFRWDGTKQCAKFRQLAFYFRQQSDKQLRSHHDKGGNEKLKGTLSYQVEVALG